MIRAVLTVLVAVALLGASLPALESARTSATGDRIEAEATALERAAASLAGGSAAVDDPDLAARTVVSVRVPVGLTAARVDRIGLGPPGDPSGRGADTNADAPDAALVYRLANGRSRVARVAPSTPVVPVRTDDDDRIALRPGGETRLELRFVDDPEDGPVVRVARVG